MDSQHKLQWEVLWSQHVGMKHSIRNVSTTRLLVVDGGTLWCWLLIILWGVTGEMIARMYVIFLCSGSIEADDQEGNSPRISPRRLEMGYPQRDLPTWDVCPTDEETCERVGTLDSLKTKQRLYHGTKQPWNT